MNKNSSYSWPIVMSFIVIGISVVVILLISFNPTYNLFQNWPFDKELASSYGTLFGGILGPLFSLISFFIVFQTLNEQIKTNKQQNFKYQFSEQIKYNREHVYSIKYVNSSDENKSIIEGPEFFIIAKMQLDKLFNEVMKLLQNNQIENCIGITFTIFYYGVGENTKETLSHELKK